MHFIIFVKKFISLELIFRRVEIMYVIIAISNIYYFSTIVKAR